MLDSNTTIKKLTSLDDSQSLINTKKEGIIKTNNTKEYDTQMPLYSKSITPHKYVYFMDKLLEKILIRYIFPLYNFICKKKLVLLKYICSFVVTFIIKHGFICI